MKFAPYLGIAVSLLLIVFCFIPWAYYPDLQENFTGFYSKGNHYGKPGVAFVFLSVCSIIFFLIAKLWAKRANQFTAVMMFAYALKTYLLFSSSYNTYTPEIKIGLIGVLVFSILILVCSLLSKADIKAEN